MDAGLALLLPILFKILFGLVSINMIINLILLYTQKKTMYKILALYWPSVLLVFVIQSFFQEGELPIILAWSASFIPVTIFALVGFEAVGTKFPLKRYLILYAATYPVILALYALGYGFTTVAMPLALAIAAPMMHSFYRIHIIDRKTSTKLQKLLAVMYVLMSIHCINFAVFRMDVETQLWGWTVAYAIYDTLAVILPSIALEQVNITEKRRLQYLVDERTAELNKTLKENDHFLRVLLHDVSNPLMVAKYHTWKHLEANTSDATLTKIHKSLEAIASIISKVKEIYGEKHKHKKVSLTPVAVEDCMNEVSFIFSQSLQKKNIDLVFRNNLSPDTRVLADKTSLTHSVLSNLVSNGLKFSRPNSLIEITAKENDNSVMLEVRDSGPGISQDVIDGLLNHEEAISSQGTMGETGSGFGLSIVKSFVDSYGGHIEFDARYMITNPKDHGTSIRITLDRV